MQMGDIEMENTSSAASPKLAAAMQTVGDHMGVIARYAFKPGMRLTFIARDPSNPECDFLMTDDVLSEIAALIERSMKRPETAPPG